MSAQMNQPECSTFENESYDDKIVSGNLLAQSLAKCVRNTLTRIQTSHDKMEMNSVCCRKEWSTRKTLICVKLRQRKNEEYTAAWCGRNYGNTRTM